MCARFRFERWLFLSEITHSFHACAQGVDASMVVSFVAVGVRVSSRFFYAKGTESVENKFPESFGKCEKTPNFQESEKRRRRRDTTTITTELPPRSVRLEKAALSLFLSKQDADIERGGCVRELDD